MKREQKIAAFDKWAADKTYGQVYGDFPVGDPLCQTNPVVIWMHQQWDKPWTKVPPPGIGPSKDSALGLIPMTRSNKERNPSMRPAFWYGLFDDVKKDFDAIVMLLKHGEWEVDGFQSGLDEDEILELFAAAVVLNDERAAAMIRSIEGLRHGYVTEPIKQDYVDRMLKEPRWAWVVNGVVTDVEFRSDIREDLFVARDNDWRPLDDNLTADVLEHFVVGDAWKDEVFPDRVVRTYVLIPIRKEVKPVLDAAKAVVRKVK